MTTETQTILTPAQFRAARTLARLHTHAWGTVPDGTYDLDAICEYGREAQGQFAGIIGPYVHKDESGWLEVSHRTGTGRLSWEITQSGNVTLCIYRPNAQTRAWEALGYPKEVPCPKATLVARVNLINNDADIFDIEDDAAEIILYGNRVETQEKRLHGWKSYADNIAYVRDSDVRSDLIAERHVYTLMRCIVELLTLDVERPGRWLPEEEYKVWKQVHLQPYIDTVRAWLAPLFEIAAPDPLDTEWINDVAWKQKRGDEVEPLPETYWHRPAPYAGRSEKYRHPIFVVHHSNEYPVESEQTAVETVRLLRETPDMTLIEAIRTAMLSRCEGDD